ncbi:MAG: sulfatase-like hydrolase/transferase [Candidatus Micrarchaeia archaeon]|jgi:membrane-anchored protein YejM (alkaline phosphatase superfamily)
MKNIILLTIDDLRYDYSHVIIKKINETIGRGIEFEKAYSTGTSSIFSFLGILCSKYSISPDEEMSYLIHKGGSLGIAYDPNKMHKRIYLTEILKNKNFETYVIANVPFIANIEYRNTIDRFITGYNTSNKEKAIMSVEKLFSAIENKNPNLRGFGEFRKRFYRILKSLIYGIHLEKAPYCSAKEITTLVKEFINKKNGRGKFIHAHYLELHTPFFSNGYIEKKFEVADIIKINRAISDGKTKKISDEELRLYKKMYLTQAEYIAENIVNLLYELKKSNFLKDTIIILTADHGQFFGEHKMPCGHGTLAIRDSKDLLKLLHEEIVHIPLIIYGLGKKRISKAVSQIGIPPTILSLLEIETPNLWYGENLLNNSNKPVISEARSGTHEYYSVRTKDWVFLYDEINGQSCLYHIGSEDNNLADTHLDIVAEMKTIIADHKNKKDKKWKTHLKNKIKNFLKINRKKSDIPF